MYFAAQKNPLACYLEIKKKFYLVAFPVLKVIL